MGAEKIFKKLPKLETKRLVLRPLKLSDADDMFEYASRPEVSRYTIWDFHRSKKDTLRFLKFAAANSKKGIPMSWAIVHKKDKKMIGTAGIETYNEQHKCAGIGYALSPYYWNKGYMTEAVTKIIEFAFKTLDTNRVEAVCDIENKASAKVMEKSGMMYEGILRKRIVTVKGRVHDVKIYGAVKGDWSGPKSSVEAEAKETKKTVKSGQAELFKS